jgi:hypothetical protein
MKKIILIVLIFCNGYTVILAQRTSAFQVGSYMPGIINVRDYAKVPAGLYIVDYNVWSNSSAYYDNDGNKIDKLNLELSKINPDLNDVEINLDMDINTYVNIPMIAYASKWEIFGAKYLAAISPLYLTSDATINFSPTSTNNSSESKSSLSGWGDLMIIPLFLAWNFELDYDLGFIYTLYAPTGRYETGASDNIGLGHWTHQFQVPFYAYFFQQATALSFIPTLELNGKNKDADITTGSRFSLEYGISHYFNEWLEIQIMNGHNWQISDDSGDDLWWNGTQLDTKDSKSTFWAGVGLWPWKNKLYVSLKYSFDYAISQRFNNEYLTLSLSFIPNLLTE